MSKYIYFIVIVIIYIYYINLLYMYVSSKVNGNLINYSYKYVMRVCLCDVIMRDGIQYCVPDSLSDISRSSPNRYLR